MKDRRKAARIVPVRYNVSVALQGIQAVGAFSTDLSESGTALIMNKRPQVGASVMLGKRYATVVRHTPKDVSGAFCLPFGALTFDERVIL